jgi:hypothetical protein
MRTFSEIIDTAIAIVKAPSHTAYAISACNAIVRELTSAFPNGRATVEHYIPVVPDNFDRNRKPVAKTVKWLIPLDYREMAAVHYGQMVPQGEFVPNRPPGKVQEKQSAYWYQSGDTIIFSGAYEGIAIAYYKLSKTFKYYSPDRRLIKSGDDDFYLTREPGENNDWFSLDPNNQIHAQRFDNHINWVIRDHPHVVLEGLLARLYNIVGNRETGGRHFSQFTTDKQTINRANSAFKIGEL